MDNENKDLPEQETSENANQATAGIVPGLTDREITNEVKTAFLNYAMSVIESRAIPDVRDGLKPVHRRIIFGMNETHMYPTSPHLKCARIVGDVMGKYHPHGDSAIYGALVHLAQPFNMRYTLVDGHGNFGDIDGEEAAAMRYTEARMTKLALEMVRDIDKNTIDFVDNYDGSLQEPAVLPSRIPNLLVNGSEGIAVGMTTSMAPHNLGEVIDAIVAYTKNNDITPEEIMQKYLPGPDFPTGGVILGRKGILEAYKTGRGTIPVRGKYTIDHHQNGKSEIIITEIPYRVNKSEMVKKIAELVREKELEGISDIRDESNRNGIKIVIEVKKDFIPEVVVNNILKRTPLQSNFSVINLCLVNGEPKVLGICDLIKYYIDFQVDVIKRRTQFLLNRDSERDNIVVGLIKATEIIHDIIEAIRASKDATESSLSLQKLFGFNEKQAAAIIEMRLRQLQALERGKLEDEHKALEVAIAEYKRLLSSRDNLIEQMVKELTDIKNKFGDKRMTEISNESSSIDDEDLRPQEDIIVVLTKNGYLKRMNEKEFHSQKRGGKGVRGISTTAGDMVNIMLHTETHTDLLFFTTYGKIYRMRGYQVPEGTRESRGIPAVNLLKLESDEKVVAIVSCDEYPEDNYLFFVTVNGTVKRTSLKEFENINSNGKRALVLKEGDSLLDVKKTDGHTIISLASNNGKVCSFNEEDVRVMGRGAAGVKGMDLSDGSHLVDVTSSLEGDKILVLTTLGFGKISYAKDTDIKDEDGTVRHYDGYRLSHRGAKGVLTLKMGPKNGELTAMRAVNGDEDLMVITTHGTAIRTAISGIKVAGRNTQGVKIIRLDGRQKVAAIAIIPHSDEEEEVEDTELVDATDAPEVTDEQPTNTEE